MLAVFQRSGETNERTNNPTGFGLVPIPSAGAREGSGEAEIFLSFLPGPGNSRCDRINSTKSGCWENGVVSRRASASLRAKSLLYRCRSNRYFAAP
jgi:hypothetical protein